MTSTMTLDLSSKEKQLKQELLKLDSVIIAYSGGVDSSLLAYYGKLLLKDKCLVVIAVSPSLASFELDFARSQAQRLNFNLIEINTNETQLPQYKENNVNRCYFCKSTLFHDLTNLAKIHNISHIAYGANLDDLDDFRPGHKAAQEYNILAPLVLAKLTKADIRLLASLANLPSYDKPQSACLSSRFPTFITIDDTKLSQVDKAEKYLHDLGFKQLRVRHHNDLARIELAQVEITRLTQDLTLMNQITEYLNSLGYKFVTLDLNGYRMGSSVEKSKI